MVIGCGVWRRAHLQTFTVSGNKPSTSTVGLKEWTQKEYVPQIIVPNCSASRSNKQYLQQNNQGNITFWIHVGSVLNSCQFADSSVGISQSQTGRLHCMCWQERCYGVAVTQEHAAVTGNVTAVLGLFCYLQYNNIFTILAMWNEVLWSVCVVTPEFMGGTE
jgi:hypothetical protein